MKRQRSPAALTFYLHVSSVLSKEQRSQPSHESEVLFRDSNGYVLLKEASKKLERGEKAPNFPLKTSTKKAI